MITIRIFFFDITILQCTYPCLCNSLGWCLTFKWWIKCDAYFWFWKLLRNCPAKEAWSFFTPTTGLCERLLSHISVTKSTLDIINPYQFYQLSEHFVLIFDTQVVKMSIFFIFVIPIFCKFTVQNLLISYLLFSILIRRDFFHILGINPLTVKYVTDIHYHLSLVF